MPIELANITAGTGPEKEVSGVSFFFFFQESAPHARKPRWSLIDYSLISVTVSNFVNFFIATPSFYETKKVKMVNSATS